MLVLSRRTEERIVIGDQIVLTVVSVHGNRVHIGIEAPLEVPVVRREVYQRKVEDETTVLDQSRDLAVFANKMEAVE